jgi:cytochrome P450
MDAFLKIHIQSFTVSVSTLIHEQHNALRTDSHSPANFSMNDAIHDYLNLSCSDPLWASLRAGAQPLFHSAALRKHALVTNFEADSLAAEVAKRADGVSAFDVLEVVQGTAIRVIFKILFGVDMPHPVCSYA